jgi:hypothetical protein
MLMAGVGSQGTGDNVDSVCWLPRDRVNVDSVAGLGSQRTGYNVDSGCWLPKERVYC